ncbi:MAG TPA: hypothetical protein VFB88_19980, partial [Xanthobacteraceae bacterium]|nr:hypothetical protein [Xanthobacteraceae bacterium]
MPVSKHGRIELIPHHLGGQPDIDLTGVAADDIDDTAGEPMVEQFAEPRIADARVPPAHGANELF